VFEQNKTPFERPTPYAVLTSCREPATLVTFLIGPSNNQSKFFVHKEFACYHSPVLSAAFNSTFLEGQTQTYALEDTTEGAFRLLVQWLYSQKLTLLQLEDQHQFQEGKTKAEEGEDKNLAELWVLADKLAIPKLQNAAIDSMEQIRLVGRMVVVSVWAYAYDIAGPDSHLRHYVVAICALLATKDLAQWGSVFPHGMLLKLACLFKDQLMGIRDNQIVMERYHVSEMD
jgi:hypothetical protein